jgi:hypothetical protein
MAMAFSNCTKLLGTPIYSTKITNLYYTYYRCYNLTGSPVCGNNVTSM